MRLLLLLLLSLAGLLPLAARAQVEASLVSAKSAIQPGKPLQVAVRLVHAPHWHTYWRNPGTGLVTKLKWSLPPGWRAGDIQWPAPKLFQDASGAIDGYGYEDDLLLPVTLTPPADLAAGTPLTITVFAEWLMCGEKRCDPGDAELSLTLPVAAVASPDGMFGGRIAAVLASLPRADARWKLAATSNGKNVILTVSPLDATAGQAFVPKDLHFFTGDNFIAFELPQEVRSEGPNFVLTLPISAKAPKDTAKLVGVLTSANGWSPDGSPSGLRVELPLTAGASATATGAPASLPGTLLLALVGGLILNLMPCVFPVLGIKILGFVNQAGQEKGKVALHGLIFALGVLLSFWALAGVLMVLRAGGQQLGWGFQLQSPLFVFGLAAVMLIFAMNMSGVFEFGLAATNVGSGFQRKSGWAGSFFTGVLATVVATPCSAPFLAPALGAALTLSSGESFAIFTSIAIGLAAPYLLLSIFPAAVKVLPRPGAWMETFKQFMAFPLYATVAYLSWVLAGQTSENGSLMAVLGLVVVALGVWFYGRFNDAGATPARARFGNFAGALVLTLGVWLGAPLAAPEVVWEKWSPDAVAKLRAEGRPVYVDFTARWCATCQKNKVAVFHSQEVLRAFADANIATLRADWTNKDAAITAELAKYQRSAVPFNLIWQPGKSEPVILPEALNAAVVLGAVNGPPVSGAPL